MFPVQGNIPIPRNRPAASGSRRRYPWRTMKVGDSFFVPCRDGEDPGKLQESIAATGVGAGKRLGTRYTTRREDDGVRVWRAE